MIKFISLCDSELAAELSADPRLPGFQIDQCRKLHSDIHVVAMRDGTLVARCSLWWDQTPALPGHRLGIIGHFAAADEAAAKELLNASCEELNQHSCTLAVGPMDGTTWRRYRLLTERGNEPPFFLEPDNPDEWPGYFFAAGFAPFATYFSALNDDLSVEDPRIPRTVGRLERVGVSIRELRPGQFVEDLRSIYKISCISFQDNHLYTPIEESEFIAQYESIRAHVRPELVLLAEHDDKPIGFVFGIPDLAKARRNQPVDTVVLKTVAVVPGRRYAGLGNVLVARCQQAARALRYRRVIHALMHESNNSLNLSAHYAKPFRRYTLYARSLKNSLHNRSPLP